MAVEKRSPFAVKLSRENKKVKADRANRIGASLEAAQKMKVYSLEGDVRQLEDKLDEMTDVSTDNVSTTLNVINKGFNAEHFVNVMHDTKVELALKKQELAIAEATYQEWFAIK